MVCLSTNQTILRMIKSVHLIDYSFVKGLIRTPKGTHLYNSNLLELFAHSFIHSNPKDRTGIVVSTVGSTDHVYKCHDRGLIH